MTPNSILADTLELSKTLTARYLAGFDDASSVRQATNLPNHVRWCLGHCALTMHRIAEKIDGKPIPESDFAAATPQPGRFHTESIAFGSRPADSNNNYPPLARSIEIYNAACDRLAAAARSAQESKLLEPTAWGTIQVPLYQLIIRMCFHNGFHTGQISDLRRAFGFKSIFA